MDFETLKKECKQVCRDYKACAPGYAALLRAETVEEIINVSVYYWNDVWRDRFADAVSKNIERWFEGLENEFHGAGLFVNEESDKGIVIINDNSQTYTFTGRARIYILGKAHIVAKDNCRVFCRCNEAIAELYDNAGGLFLQGKVTAHDFAHVDSHQECTCYQLTNIIVSNGVCHDFGHRHLHVNENAKVLKTKEV